ncbi:electron transfer flavoprotein [Thecamonas trahens ATCC 50062]|uniref:Electron transfer flavoprotein subunit alpha n=1 Tax=Thecamonas trahens ATCC 50062 TaxID=461836 RepID=A0A0L0DL01_THETB|nr:electron transfer flavoprotein [Thecamonas trahens ATCC 50062]KNC52925.1 electron transfer flavoprotein [Thecamonas trahens ATCC 50062]|eukprot:XP_013754821.1 electron transfer flavoprotein [Thecamonas trahens ATCC 50062]
MLNVTQNLVRATPRLARSASALVIAEHDNSSLAKATRHAVSAAAAVAGSDPVAVLVAGSNCSAVADAAAAIDGVSQVLVVDAPEVEHPIAENLAAAAAAAVEAHGFGTVAAAATVSGKNVIPRIGALLNAQPISEVVEVVSEDTFVRPIYAGNALATVKSSDPVKLMTVRATNFDAAPADGGSADIVAMDAPDFPLADKVKFVSAELSQSDRPDLASAPVVVSGGRGLKSGENFAMLEKLADLLGGAMGASRAAVDEGMVNNALQIGQTGLIVAPDLYIAVGISGAIQHLAGMKDSKVIVAINKDAEAPIFSVADYGLEGDLFQIVPELTEKIAAIKSAA